VPARQGIKGYNVYMGKETERIVECHLPDGAVRAMSILDCSDANGGFKHPRQ
jgi:hypothetical protein